VEVAHLVELVALLTVDGALGEPALALPAAWAQRADLIDVLTEMRSVVVSTAESNSRASLLIHSLRIDRK
jgi:hypothetical protein